MKLVKGPLLVVVVCTIIGSTTPVLAKNGDNHMDRRLYCVVVTLLSDFYSSVDQGFHCQRAFLILLTESEVHQSCAAFRPHIVCPTRRHTLTPTNPENYGNHLAAIPIYQKKSRYIHTEEQILGELDSLRIAYEKHGNKPYAIVLFTYRAPCLTCTERIVDYIKKWRLWSSYHIFVLYTNGTGRNTNVSYTEEVFHESHINLHQVPSSEYLTDQQARPDLNNNCDVMSEKKKEEEQEDNATLSASDANDNMGNKEEESDHLDLDDNDNMEDEEKRQKLAKEEL